VSQNHGQGGEGEIKCKVEINVNDNVKTGPKRSIPSRVSAVEIGAFKLSFLLSYCFLSLTSQFWGDEILTRLPRKDSK
jgi:hypothetical protein